MLSLRLPTLLSFLLLSTPTFSEPIEAFENCIACPQIIPECQVCPASESCYVIAQGCSFCAFATCAPPDQTITAVVTIGGMVSSITTMPTLTAPMLSSLDLAPGPVQTSGIASGSTSEPSSTSLKLGPGPVVISSSTTATASGTSSSAPSSSTGAGAGSDSSSSPSTSAAGASSSNAPSTTPTSSSSVSSVAPATSSQTSASVPSTNSAPRSSASEQGAFMALVGLLASAVFM